MRFHIVALPHTSFTAEFGSCAYTDKARKFANGLTAAGHEVFLYGGPRNDLARCSEYVACLQEEERKVAAGSGHYTQAATEGPMWDLFMERVINGIKKRALKRDFICSSFGWPQRALTHAFPAHLVVEYGIGYHGTFSQWRIFESYAWMHSVYAAQNAKGSDADGVWFDAVIPGFYEPSQFNFKRSKKDYLLFVGRVIDRKGYRVAMQVAQETGRKLLIAGAADATPVGDNVEYVGEVGAEKRAQLMANAYALIAPTVYVEPFGNVVIEAQACGTPTITTDWGAFTETNIEGVTGFRCRTLQEFCEAVDKCRDLKPHHIAASAEKRFAVQNVIPQFEKHFRRLEQLWVPEGWALRKAA